MKGFYDWDCISYPFQLQLSFVSSMTFTLKHDFRRLPDIMSWDVETVRRWLFQSGRWRWALLLKTLKNSMYHCSWGKGTSYLRNHFLRYVRGGPMSMAENHYYGYVWCLLLTWLNSFFPISRPRLKQFYWTVFTSKHKNCIVWTEIIYEQEIMIKLISKNALESLHVLF